MTSIDSTVPLIIKQLKKVLGKEVKELPQLEVMETECRKQIASLVNLLGQRQSVLEVGQSKLPASLGEEFPDLTARLLVKISAEVDNKVELLRDKIQVLAEHHRLVSLAQTDLLRLLQKLHSNTDQHEQTPASLLGDVEDFHGSPTTPPLPVMLDWVDRLELALRQIFYARSHYLDSILDAEVVTTDNLAALWAHDSSLLDTLKDVSEQGKYFLEDSR